MNDAHDLGAERPLPPEILAAYVVPDPPAGFADRVLARIGDAVAAGPMDPGPMDPALPADLLARYRTPSPPGGFADSVLHALAGEGLVRQPPPGLQSLPPAPRGGRPFTWKLTAVAAAAALAVFAGQALFAPRTEGPLLARLTSLRVTPRVTRGSFHVPAPPDPLEVFFVAAPAGASRLPRSDGRR